MREIQRADSDAMTPQRWQQIDRIFKSAIERTPEERPAFLAEACDDEDLRAEVESLVSAHELSGEFLDSPAYELVGAEYADGPALLAAGQQIKHYEVQSVLGIGGMGEVYLAYDTKLGRNVALKLLPRSFATDRSRVRRFAQEARAASTLNHPNVCMIYEIDETADGRHFIAMEYVAGLTLRERLHRGPLDVADATDIALQVASAVQAAHAGGVLHRDIKPENIVLRSDGLVKVLDFGLAKFTDSTHSTRLKSLSTIKTEPGLIMGTAKYMSPEQARGAETDERSDIWSLGVVLYEMVAGRVPFEGSTNMDVMAEILKGELPVLGEGSARFQHMHRVIGKAVSKDPAGRYSSASEFATAIRSLDISGPGSGQPDSTTSPGDNTSEHPGSPQTIASAAPLPVPRGARRFSTATVVVAAMVVLGAVTAFGIYRLISQQQPKDSASVVPFSEMSISRLSTSGKITHAAISPDGKYVAHVTVDADGQSVWVRNVAAPSSVRVAGPAATEYVSVTFAPDSDSVYYLTLDRDKGQAALYRVPVLGGPSSMVASDVGSVGFSPNGSEITFVRSNRAQTHLIVASADGSNERTLAMRRQPEFFRESWNAPAWSPDGKTIACQVRLSDERGQYETVVGVSVADGSQTPLTSQRWSYTGQPAWLADGSGLLVTASERTTAPVQVWHITLKGGEATRITNDLNDYHDLSLTADAGRLTAVQVNNVSSIWVAPEGDANRAKQIASDAGAIQEMAWTPDGRIVYRSNAGGSAEVWVMNADGSNPKQLTEGAHLSRGLTVSPDGRYIFFASDRAGRFNIWRVGFDGGDLKQLTNGDGEFFPNPTPDGRWVVYQRGEAEARLWKVATDGGEPVQLTETRAVRPAVSPDGELIAYHYLDPSLEKSRWGIGIVSAAGGQRLKRFDFPPTVTQRLVRWSPDGQSIGFANSPGGLSDIWLQPLDGSPPRRLTNFKAERILAFDWSRDGRSLALVRDVETSDVVLIERGQK